MDDDGKKNILSSDNPIWSSMFFLAFGCALLLFLVAIEHQNWFHIKPMSGTATAMSYAAKKPAKPNS